eukprot:scaffold5295_cov164-Skeletonema_dohrnii-CCMP3373.AAC.1
MPLWHLAHLCREEQHPSNNKKNIVVLASNAAWASLQSYVSTYLSLPQCRASLIFFYVCAMGRVSGERVEPSFSIRCRQSASQPQVPMPLPTFQTLSPLLRLGVLLTSL